MSAGTQYKQRKKAGLCVECGKVATYKKHSRCKRCLLALRKYANNRRKKLKKIGLCASCAKPRKPGRILCEACLARKRDEKAKLSEARRALRPKRDYARVTGVPMRMKKITEVLRALIVLRKGRWTIAEFADEIGVAPRTTYRLIEALKGGGFTIEVSREQEHDRGSPTAYYSIPGEPLRKLLKL